MIARTKEMMKGNEKRRNARIMYVEQSQVIVQEDDDWFRVE